LKFVILLLVSTVTFAAEPAANQRFVGAWKLMSFEQRNASGEVSFPLGDPPVGRIIYEPNGLMMIHIMRSNRTAFANNNPRAATNEEVADAFRGTTAYFGTYTVEVASGEVVHHVEASHFPNLGGRDVRRRYRFEGDTLTLEGGNASGEVRLVWRRLQ